MPKQIKICPVCGKSSKALHLHQRKHDKENKLKEMQESIEGVEAIKANPPLSSSQPSPDLEKPLPDLEKPLPDLEKPLPDLVGQDIPLTADMAETPAEKEEVTNVNGCEYRLTLVLNGETLDCFTNNLKISLMSYARPIATEGFITIKKGQAEFVKKMTLIQLKQLFADPQSLDIFLEGFYGLYGRPQNEQRLNSL
jgi:hypothetical protein